MPMQEEATIKLGLAPNPTADFWSEFQSFVPKRTREEKVRNPTYMKPLKSTTLGAEIQSVVVKFYSSHLSTGVFGLLWSAMGTDEGKLYFDVKPKLLGVSVDNPRFTGVIKVSAIDLFATAGEDWEQNHTWPAEDITMITA